MKIAVINPNTTASMTATIADAARRVANAGTEIEAITGTANADTVFGGADTASGALQAARHGKPWLWLAALALLLCGMGAALPAGRTQGRWLMAGGVLAMSDRRYRVKKKAEATVRTEGAVA